MALDFQGSADSVTVGSDASLDNILAGTFIVLTNPDDQAGVIIHAQKNGTNNATILSQFGGATSRHLLCEQVRATTALKADSNLGSPPSDTWIWLASQWDQAGVDGDQKLFTALSPGALLAEVGSYVTQQVGAGSHDNAAGDLFIGNRETTQKDYQGQIAVAAIWSRTLSLGDKHAFQRYGWVGANCEGLWLFGRQFGTGSQLDLSGNGNNGTVNGAALSTEEPPVPWLLGHYRRTGVPAVAVRVLRPDATVAAGGWTPQPGGTLHGNTSDDDDATDAQSPVTPSSADIVKLGMDNPADTVGEPVTVRVRWRQE